MKISELHNKRKLIRLINSMLVNGIITILVFSNNTYSSPELRTDRSSTHQIADSLFALKEYSEAANFYLLAATNYHLDKKWEKEIICLNEAGYSYWKSRQYDNALETLTKSLEEAIKHLSPDNENLARIFHLQSLSYYSKGDYYQARFAEEEAVKRWKVIFGESSLKVAKGYQNIGLYCRNTGVYEKALEYYGKAMFIRERELDSLHPDIASTVNNIAIVYMELGDYNEALKYSLRSVNLCQNKHPVDSVLLAKKYNNLGLVYFSIGDTINSLSYRKKTLNLRLKLKGINPLEIAESYLNVGRINKILGHSDTALFYYQKALDIYLNSHDKLHPDQAICYFNISSFYLEKGDYNNALLYNAKALATGSEFYMDHHPRIAICYLTYSDIHDHLGNTKEAFSYLNKALNANTLNGRVLSGQRQIMIYNALANLYIKNYETISADTLDLIYALETFKKSTDIIDNIRKGYRSKESMLILGKTVSDMYANAIRIAYQLYKITGNSSHIKTAFYFAEKNRSNVLVESILELRSQGYSSILDGLISLEKDIKTKLHLCDSLQQKERFKKEKRDEKYIQELEQQYASLTTSYDSLIEVFEKNYKNYFLLRHSSSTITPSEVQQALPENTGLIEYMITDSILFTIIITKTQLLIYKSPGDSIQNFVKQLRSSISKLNINQINNTSLNQYLSSAYKLYQLLIQPVANASDIKKWVIITDGITGSIPFEVLLSEAVKEENTNFKTLPYLLHKYTLTYGNSATIQFNLLNSLKSNAKQSFLGMAPFCEINSCEIQEIEDTLILPGLPSSQTEIESIQELAGGKIILNAEATKSSFLENANRYKIIHIATHGLLNDKEPLESSLYFYPNQKNKNDVLKINDLFSLQLDAEMAVLSACNTGFGKIEQGEGIMSLARGFSYAGIPTVTMSMWNVNDKSTSKIMKSFYTHIQNRYLISDALQMAKIDYIQQSDQLHATPFYWGGFIQIGRNSQIDLSEKPSYYWLFILIIPLLGIVIFKRRKKNK